MAKPQYIRQIMATLNRLGLKEDKEEIVSEATGGRTNSLRAMWDREAIALIRRLNERGDSYVPPQDSANRMRRKILALCHEMNWEYPDGRVDMERVNAFCQERGHGHKPLNDYTEEELPALVTQFQRLHANELSKS